MHTSAKTTTGYIMKDQTVDKVNKFILASLYNSMKAKASD